MFLVEVFKMGVPKYPLYYISSIIEAVLGYLAFRFYKKKPKGRLRLFGGLFFLICFLMPIILHNVKSDFLWQLEGSELWFIFVGMSLIIYEYFKKYKSDKQKEEEIKEYKQVTKFIFYFAIATVLPWIVIFLILFFLWAIFLLQ